MRRPSRPSARRAGSPTPRSCTPAWSCGRRPGTLGIWAGEPELQRYLKDVGLHTNVAELAFDGSDLLAADMKKIDVSDADAVFLRAALEWWDITSTCVDNPKMIAAIGGRRA